MTKNKLLVVVDYQNDFVDGSLGFEDAKAIESNICAKIEEYTKSGNDVIFTLDTHSQKYLLTDEGKNLPIKHCIKGTQGHKLYGKVEILARNKVQIEKPTFPSLELAKFIEGKDYGEIELCGVVTNICVISNAVMAKAAAPDCKITVDASCCASNDPNMESMSYEIMKNLHITVIGND